ncbi:secreted protein [Rhodopirellula maiorica SM1]|uniref:Secreted protein n=1 Tax=Rhodopirellula maiorica SM1 TaxID=1265738 RepID=M5RPT3_9BACT|nr:hypothetical protein [Rhodopirellula maiorica]EMI21231.1 secreted protein [Rhodopirellula maiorica SM1]
MRTRIFAFLLGSVFVATSTAFAQDVILYRPVVQPVAAAPMVVARPNYSPVAAPVVTSPVVVQRPTLYDPQPVAPVVSYSPAVPAAPAAYVAPVAPAPVVVRPKVYVPGRPIYNFFQAITP